MREKKKGKKKKVLRLKGLRTMKKELSWKNNFDDVKYVHVYD